jgi:hypothetical protein
VRPMSFAILRSSVGEISRPAWNGTVVPRPSEWRNCLWDPFCRTSPNPRPLEKGNYLPRLERGQLAHYATLMVCSPTNSDSSWGSPSSRSMLTTS